MKKSNKRAGRIMNALQAEGMDAVGLDHVEPFSPGDAVKVTWRDSTDDTKGGVYKGICIWQRRKGLSSSFRIINYYEQTDYFEMSFPLYSPLLTSVEVLEKNYVNKVLKKPGKVRRAKLYYVTELAPHLVTLP
jgi:ribosomal protein L19